MKKLIALLLVGFLALSCAVAEDYSAVAKYYLNNYGQWWNYSPELWQEYAAAVSAADAEGSSSALAIAATEYVLPPEGALTYEEAKTIAIAAVDPRAQARPLVPCFMLEDRAVYKVILYIPGHAFSTSHTVELDAMTGEVLGVYPALTVEAACFFVPNAVWAAVTLQYTPEELAQMSWLQLFDAYLARHGHWKDWNSILWGQFVTAVRAANVSSSRTGRAVAATEYIRATHDMLFEEDAAVLAVAAVGGEAYADNLVLCCMAEGRAIYKLTLHTPDQNCSVELDAYTGEILGIYPQTTDGVGQFFVPHATWEATPVLAPNG